MVGPQSLEAVMPSSAVCVYLGEAWGPRDAEALSGGTQRIGAAGIRLPLFLLPWVSPDGPLGSLLRSQTATQGHRLTLIDGSQGVSQHEEPALFAQHLRDKQEAGTADVRGGPPAHDPQACWEKPAGAEAKGRMLPDSPGLAEHPHPNFFLEPSPHCLYPIYPSSTHLCTE